MQKQLSVNISCLYKFVNMTAHYKGHDYGVSPCGQNRGLLNCTYCFDNSNYPHYRESLLRS